MPSPPRQNPSTPLLAGHRHGGLDRSATAHIGVLLEREGGESIGGGSAAAGVAAPLRGHRGGDPSRTPYHEQTAEILQRLSDGAHQLDLMAVQQNIASGLGLLLTDGEDETHRARAIFNFLKEKKFLLLIDDLWDMPDFVKVGIPHGSKKCSLPNSQIVVVTTRSLEVCGRMRIFENVIQLKCLNSDHSWQLFKDIVGGKKMEDARIRGCAAKIAAKCGGLPLAIKITGQAMASKVASEEWEYSLMLVEDSVFHQVSSSDNELFPILKISDSLQSDVIRMCFLLFAGGALHVRDNVCHVIFLN
ncbi:probable disease resistance protein At1g61310 [Triticum aestivum]|uniref:probable disease resistance protein At1g61310 n=1 Tax=Triticum aestivum TaxID=4565 RepID=UPI001D00A00E|nr:probable disease resistance protein At1g61310 [Triticum aestivum]